MPKPIDVTYIPQTHTLEYKEGRQSQAKITDYLHNEITNNPDKIHVIFYESDISPVTEGLTYEYVNNLHDTQKEIRFYNELKSKLQEWSHDKNFTSDNITLGKDCSKSVPTETVLILKELKSVDTYINFMKEYLLFIYSLLKNINTKYLDNIILVPSPDGMSYEYLSQRERELHDKVISILQGENITLSDKDIGKLFDDVDIQVSRLIRMRKNVTVNEVVRTFKVVIEEDWGIKLNHNAIKTLLNIFFDHRLIFDTRERLVIEHIKRTIKIYKKIVSKKCPHIKNRDSYFTYYLVFGKLHEFEQYSPDDTGIRFKRVIDQIDKPHRGSYVHNPRMSIIERALKDRWPIEELYE